MSAFVLSVVLTADPPLVLNQGTRQEKRVPSHRWAEFSVIQDMGTPEQRVETMRLRIDPSFPIEAGTREVTGADLRMAAVQALDLPAAVALVPDEEFSAPVEPEPDRG